MSSTQIISKSHCGFQHEQSCDSQWWFHYLGISSACREFRWELIQLLQFLNLVLSLTLLYFVLACSNHRLFHTSSLSWILEETKEMLNFSSSGIITIQCGLKISVKQQHRINEDLQLPAVIMVYTRITQEVCENAHSWVHRCLLTLNHWGRNWKRALILMHTEVWLLCHIVPKQMGTNHTCLVQMSPPRCTGGTLLMFVHP